MSLAVLLLVVAGGTLATYLWDDHEMPLPTRVAAGVALGLAVFGLAGFLLALPLGLTGTVVLTATAVAAAPLALLAQPERRARLAADAADTLGVLRARPLRTFGILAAALLIAFVFEGALYERPDGIY